MISEFSGHFEELRKRVFVSLLFLALASLIAYFFSRALLDLCTQPLLETGATLYFSRPYEAFFVHIKVSVLAGIILSSPLLLTQLWLFIAPGLYQNEKKTLVPLIFFSVGLFLAGILFAYFVMIPWGLRFLLSFQTESMKPLLGVDPYFSFLIVMMLSTGVLFDFPVVVIGLSRLGLVKSSQMRKARRFVIVVIVILAAILTPSPDPISQLLLALPIWGLFEISLFIARISEKRNHP